MVGRFDRSALHEEIPEGLGGRNTRSDDDQRQFQECPEVEHVAGPGGVSTSHGWKELGGLDASTNASAGKAGPLVNVIRGGSRS